MTVINSFHNNPINLPSSESAAMSPQSVDKPVDAGLLNHNYILVVDDDPGIHMLVSAILRQLDVEVRYARDGLEALELIALEHPSLIILDLQMPNLDGYGMLEVLRRRRMGTDVPVIVFSGGVNPVYSRNYEWPPQVFKFVEKTTSPRILRNLVKERLGL